MGLPTLPKVQKLQEALPVKAKRSSDFRFYTLYDKLYRTDVLWVAHRRCLINGGAPGVGAPLGNKNAQKHGFYTAGAEAERRRLRALMRLWEKSLAEIA